ncbi:cation channel sperm-associated targeting subunit tau isoform X2 [Dasypus novemcinctus]|uniref:cation channel sperm-associated targeting subunit tau isoform X2 n=1 Tax=Dasypus novemcinctus TaxID=9361 RepID=UPI00265EF250|nr:cation channel sperm-associated targeting subunit tau isoform X2 [Dasypus novemcinctus]
MTKITMQMLGKTLKGSESKELNVTPDIPNLVPFGDVVGCLAIHVKNCRHFTPKIFLQHYNNLFIRITVNNVVKCTKMHSLPSRNSEKNAIIKFNEVKYFSVQVPRRQDDDRNNIHLELMEYDGIENYPLLLANVQLHLYEVILKGCFTEELQMLNKSTFICRLEVEFMFSYGNFGYGFSHQLKPLQKIIEPSMFMNITPPPERTDPVSNVITPQPVEYPAFLSPDLNVTVGMPSKVQQPSQPSVVRLEKLQQQPRERLEKMKKEYRNLNTWFEKASYIENILSPVLEHIETKESNTNDVPEILSNNQLEEKPETIITSDAPLINEEAESIPKKLPDNDDKKGLTLPTLNQTDQDDSTAIPPKSDELRKQIYPLISISSTENSPSSDELQSEAIPEIKEGKVKNELSSLGANLKASYPSPFQTKSPPSEYSYLPFTTGHGRRNFHYLVDKSIEEKNTNRKGKLVAFSPTQYISPSFRPKRVEIKPQYQFQKFSIKTGLDPFLRNINNKMSVGKRRDQDMSKCINILGAEVIEHEDQDPPYPARPKTAGPVNITRALDPESITIKALDTKKKLLGREPCLSFPNFERESSMTENVNIHRFSKSLSLTSHIENLQQSMVLKSILSKKLQDLSDELFSKPEVHVDIEERKKSYSFPLLSVPDKPTDLNWLSEKDILSPKALISGIIKSSPTDSLSERGPGKSTEVEREHVSEKHLEAGERIVPMKRKSSFKKKHLQSEVSSSKPDLNGSVHDYFIKQIFTAPSFSKIGVKESTETQLALWDQLPTAWQGSLPLHNLCHCEDDGTELPQSKSVISQIIQAFPIDTLIESGLIKVVELDEECQKSSFLNSETGFPEEKSNYSRKDYSETKGNANFFPRQNIPTVLKEIPFAFNQVKKLDENHRKSSLLNSDIGFPEEKPNYSTNETKSKTEPFSKQNISIFPKETTFDRVKFINEVPNISPQDSKYQSTPDRKTDLPRNVQRLYREENDINSTLQNLSSSLVGKLNESDEIMLKSVFRNIFSAFLKYNQSETKPPERELENLIQHSFPDHTEDLEDIGESIHKANKLDSKTILSPKLRLFLEELSESEIKHLKSELSKHIQHYLVERLSESGHISQEDLPKIYQNLYLMNEKTEPKGQSIFLEKYSETVKEIMSFVNNFNHHFIDKHLEIKLRSFLNEILQNYFVENLSESRLFEETESETTLSNTSSPRTKSASISLHDLGQDISRESFGRRLEINMKYPLSKFLQHYLIALSENELSNLTADLGKQLLSLFIEQLSKSGLITERQLEGINQYINMINSSSTPLKCIKTDLAFKDENQFTEEHSEKQNKYSKIVSKKVPEDKCLETELMRKEENEHFSLHNSKETSSIIREQKIYYSKEGAKTLSLIKVQPSSNTNTKAIPLNKSPESLSDIVFKNQRKEHGFIQLPRAENSVFKAEIQDPYSWGGKAKLTQSKVCFERTLKMKPIEKKEHINIYKLTVQEKPESRLSPYARIPNCKLPNEDEEYLNRLTFPSWQNNTLTHFNSETREKSKLEDQYYHRLKGNNNNNKKHLVTFAQYKKDIQTLRIKPNGICSEKCVKTPESHSFKYNFEGEKNSKSSLFPEVLKRESLKPKVRKERDYVGKQNQPFSKIVRILPTTLSNTRIHLRKSVPKTLLHWTARRTVHDCSDKFEDLHVTSFKHLEKTKSRTRLLGKSPDDSQNQSKFSTRPYTAPEFNKRRQSYIGKFTSPRMVSAGLVHINNTVSSYEMHKMQQKRLLKENDEKCSLICDIIQMLNSSE